MAYFQTASQLVSNSQDGTVILPLPLLVSLTCEPQEDPSSSLRSNCPFEGISVKISLSFYSRVFPLLYTGLALPRSNRCLCSVVNGREGAMGKKSINISKINSRKQHKSDPLKSLSQPKCLFPNLIPTKQLLNYLIHLLTDEPLDGDLSNIHFHFSSQTLDFIIKERSPCFSRSSMHCSSPVRTSPLVSIPSFPKCESQFAFSCIT